MKLYITGAAKPFSLLFYHIKLQTQERPRTCEWKDGQQYPRKWNEPIYVPKDPDKWKKVACSTHIKAYHWIQIIIANRVVSMFCNHFQLQYKETQWVSDFTCNLRMWMPTLLFFCTLQLSILFLLCFLFISNTLSFMFFCSCLLPFCLLLLYTMLLYTNLSTRVMQTSCLMHLKNCLFLLINYI